MLFMMLLLVLLLVLVPLRMIYLILRNISFLWTMLLRLIHFLLLYLSLFVVAIRISSLRRCLSLSARHFRFLDRFRAVLQMRRLHASEKCLAAHGVSLGEHTSRLATVTRTSHGSVVSGEHHRSMGIWMRGCPLLSQENYGVPVRI